MRLRYSHQLTVGMKLGKSIFDQKLRLLLKDGTVLDSRYISLIQSKQINFVFIDDPISEGLSINILVSDKIKYKLSNCIETYVSSIITKIPTYKKNFYDRFKFALDGEFIKRLPYKELRDYVEEVLYDIESNDAEKRFFNYYKYKRNFTEINFDILIVSLLIGMKFEYGRQELIQLGVASLLHDIGWIFSPNYNEKNHDFSSQEIDDENHARYGYQFLRDSKHLTALEYIPSLEHHELADGTGFPDKKESDFSFPDRLRREKDNQIFRLSEIIGVASELINRCQYEEANEILSDFRVSNNIRYNPHIIEALSFVFNPFPISVEVSLTSKDSKSIATGIVISSVIPRFIPSVKTMEFKVIPADEVSRLNINII